MYKRMANGRFKNRMVPHDGDAGFCSVDALLKIEKLGHRCDRRLPPAPPRRFECIAKLVDFHDHCHGHELFALGFLEDRSNVATD
jgi:hypothetical protein